LALAIAKALLVKCNQPQAVSTSTTSCTNHCQSKELIQTILSSKVNALPTEAIELSIMLLDHQATGWHNLVKDLASGHSCPAHVFTVLQEVLDDPYTRPQLQYEIAQTLIPRVVLQDGVEVPDGITELLCLIDPFLIIPAFLPRLEVSRIRRLMTVRTFLLLNCLVSISC